MNRNMMSVGKSYKVTFYLLAAALLLLGSSQNSLGATSAEIQEWLQAHNTYRALHGVPNVTWSDAVAQSAQAYADTCPSGHSGSIYGENLAYSNADPKRSNEYVTTLWYNEEPLYDYNNPGYFNNPGAGHFTQVVWKSTTEIGCGYRSGCSIDLVTFTATDVWVCQYNPPGNYIGQFPENVFPPGTPVPGGQGGGSQNSSLPSIFQLLLNN